MARNLLADRPIETVMPISSSTRRAKRARDFAGGMPCRRSVPARSRKASSIDSGSTCGVSSSMRLAHLAPGLGVLRHIGFDDHRLRAQPPRLEHRHGRADAESPRHIAGGRNHAALAAADNQGVIAQRRVVAFFNCGVECVTIDMGDSESFKLGVSHQPRRAAAPAAFFSVGRVAQAVPAKARHRCHPAAKKQRSGY